LNYWSYKSCKAPVKSSPPTNQHPFFYRPDALPVTQPTLQALKGKYHIPWTNLPQAHLGVFQLLYLTTNSSWLPWGRVAMPLISPLMPVPQTQFCTGQPNMNKTHTHTTIIFPAPCAGSGTHVPCGFQVERTDSLCLLAGCHRQQLNQALSVLLAQVSFECTVLFIRAIFCAALCRVCVLSHV